jgi:hypothetical protein
MLRHVDLVGTDVSEERSAFIIRLIRIGEQRQQQLVQGRCEEIRSRFFQEPHGVTSQKTAFFLVTVVNTSNLTQP